jgi:hypothetical protein
MNSSVTSIVALAATVCIVSAGCSLGPRERLVVDMNVKVQEVEAAAGAVSEEIYNLLDEPTGPDSFTALIAAYRSYRESADALVDVVHQLPELAPELTEHISSSFDPAVTEALAGCVEAVTAFESAESDDTQCREALATLSLCIEHYGDALNELAREYGRVAE